MIFQKFPKSIWLVLLGINLLFVCAGCKKEPKVLDQYEQYINSYISAVETEKAAQIELQIKEMQTIVNEKNLIDVEKQRYELLNQKYREAQKKKEEQMYTSLQRILDAAKNAAAQVFDYEEKGEIYTTALDKIVEFVEKVSDKDLQDSAALIAKGWIADIERFRQKVEALEQQLSGKLEKKAKDAAYSRHPMSNIERIEVIDQNKYKDGKYYNVEITCNVRMKGGFFGNNIFKLKITVSGYVDMSNDSTGVNNEVLIEE